MREHADTIRKFVARGGAYLGICMGAYWAGKEFFNILHGLDAVQYIKQPTADTRRPHPKNIDVHWNGVAKQMYFYDGCTFTGHGKHDTVATYANGQPMAIIQNRIGLIGCHPESEAHWYTTPSWMQGKYHNGKDHKLLLQFVNTLIKN